LSSDIINKRRLGQKGWNKEMIKNRIAQVMIVFLASMFLIDGVLNPFRATANEDQAVSADKVVDQTQADTQSIQGTWKFVSVEYEGQPNPKKIGDTITFMKDRIMFDQSGIDAAKIHDMTFKLDAATKPKEIDMITKMGKKVFSWKGIYELDGNTLKYCIAKPDRPRAKDFATGFRNGRTLSVLERVQPNDQPK
jgi:uncharacterized protein (TIGR03067 family)